MKIAELWPMKSCIAILRGINVSGQKKINMKDLKALFEALGAENVVTYIQSGNVIFRHKEKNVKKLSRLIEKKISEKYGFEVPVLVKSAEQLIDVLAKNPYRAEGGFEQDRLYFTLLYNQPQPELVKKISQTDYSPEQFLVDGSTVYFYCPIGYGKTKLHNNFFESKLKVTATTRNLKTMNKLVELAEENI